MKVSCARLDLGAAGAHAHVIPGPVSGALVQGVHLTAGVCVEVDLLAPGGWQAVTSPPTETAESVLHDLISDAGARGAGSTPPESAAPWLRVAVIDALDRWLQTPLAQSLVDAERGVARGRAARTLPDGPARAVLTGEALRLARRSSRDVAALLRRLGRHSRPLPDGLFSALRNVVDGYSELIGDVTGPDRDLASVLDGWKRLSRRLAVAERAAVAAGPSGTRPSTPSRSVHALTQVVSMIDPRQVRARVLALSMDPAEPEVTMAADGPGAVRVRVPAFGPRVDLDTAARLLVRLVDRRSAEPRCHALLRASRDGRCWEATVPLWGLEMTDVRADVVDALSDLPPAADDADGALQECRRAAVFLVEWRRLVGWAQLGVVTTAPARHLQRLAALLQPSRARAEEPLFTGGPSCAELERLGELGDDELLRRLRGDGPLAEGLRVLTAGPAGLLVAELAALFVAPAA